MDRNTFWKGVFTDVDGSFSFKRVQTAIFTFLFSIIVLANLFAKLSVTDNILDILAGLTVYGYTGIVAEKFTKRGMEQNTDIPVK